ncbi:MAG: T9SS type A sorting domain-containing protein [Saprospirales bacterium]|nr:T9SS type A sorting domain-containing protein [Saprospirales bacterium]
MKKIVLLLILAGMAAGLFWLRPACCPGEKAPALRLPGGPHTENRAQREAWELERLADPATGRIPEGIGFFERHFVSKLPQAVAVRSGGDWVSRGPWNYGGRTRALAIDIADENRLLAGGVSGGMWLSEDGGQSWARRTPLDAVPSCVSVAQDPRPGRTGTWYYLSGELYGNSAGATGAYYFGDGLYKSTDGGFSWAQATSTSAGNPQVFTTPYQTGWRVITSPTDSADVVYMALYGGIYRSADGGASWNIVLGTGDLSSGAYFTDIASTSTGILYATLSSDGVQGGIWRSVNGTQWTNITPTGFPAVYDCMVIGINPNNESEVYFLAATPGSGHYNYYISGDDWSSLWTYTYLGGSGSGVNGLWENRSQNLPGAGTQFDRFAAQGGYDLVVRVQPGTNHVFVGGTSIWRSTDGFSTPNHTTLIGGYKPGTDLPFFELYPNHHPDIHDLLFLPSDANVLLSATDAGVHRTNDANAPVVEWISLNRGYQTTQFYTAMIEHSTPGDPVILGGLQDNGNLIVPNADPGQPWKQTINGDGGFGAIADGRSFYVVSAQSGGAKVVKCTIDDAGNVTAFRRIDPAGAPESAYAFINPLAIDPSDQNILYLPAGRRLYRQSELGNIALTNAWDSIAQGWTMFPDTTLGNITALGVSTRNPAHRVYVGTSARRIYRIDNAHTGTPAMAQLTNTSVSNSAFVSCVAVDPDNADRVVAVYSNYAIYSIFLSVNGGQSWKKVGGNLEVNTGGGGAAPSIRWISILPLPDGSRKYFCATSAGLFSADTLKEHTVTLPGTQWKMEAPGLIGSSVVNFVDVRPADGLVVAATHGSGMFSANFMPAVGNFEPTLPADIRVFPNPATDQVRFEFPDHTGNTVRLRLFDLQGRLVRQTSWSGGAGRLSLEGLASGVYLYELSGEGWKTSGRLARAR